MKKLITTILIMVVSASVVYGKTFQKITEVQGTQQELFDKAIDWVSQEFTDFTKRRDSKRSLIIAKGFKKLGFILGKVSFNMTIETKNNKVRVTITTIQHYTTSGNEYSGAGAKNKTLKVYEEMNDKLINYIQTTKTGNSDW